MASHKHVEWSNVTPNQDGAKSGTRLSTRSYFFKQALEGTAGHLVRETLHWVERCKSIDGKEAFSRAKLEH
jgi:hypothetical protein